LRTARLPTPLSLFPLLLLSFLWCSDSLPRERAHDAGAPVFDLELFLPSPRVEMFLTCCNLFLEPTLGPMPCPKLLRRWMQSLRAAGVALPQAEFPLSIDKR
jgi:hypothetical protein